MRQLSAWCLLAWVAVVLPAQAQNTTTRVSIVTGGAQGTGNSGLPAMSADGRFVAFDSVAVDLVPADTNNRADIFVHDRQTGTTQRVNLGPGGVQAIGGDSTSPSISADGRFVAFASNAANLVSNDTNGVQDVFVRDRLLNTTIRVNVATSGIQAMGGYSSEGKISADGRFVASSSDATNLVSGDTNGQTDVFRRDLATSTTVRISVSNGTPSGGNAQATGSSFGSSISADGRYVAFFSIAPNLVFGDSNGKFDVFVRDMQLFTTRRASIGPGGVQGNAESLGGYLSSDGRFVVFTSRATNFTGDSRPGVYIHDRLSQTTSILIVSNPDAFVWDRTRISGDGRFICLDDNPNGGERHVFVIDRLTLTKSLVSVATSGDVGNRDSFSCTINAAGTAVAFVSAATNLVGQDTNARLDVFVRTFLPTIGLDKTTLNFGAVTNGSSFVTQTATQEVRLTETTGSGTTAWTATPDQPWLHVTPASGSASGVLSISVTPAAGTIALSVTGAANTPPPITVQLTLMPNGTSSSPIGSVDTPTNNLTGVTGAIPFTGWALDDVEVTQVSICRAAVGAESAPSNPNCGGAAEILVDFATLIDFARPDVAAILPTFPFSTRAGWAVSVLTDALPGQGNGTYTFRVRAFDRDGHVSLLGTRTMTCANANATLPFGTLDTPSPGGVVSGTSYVVFGWALTPLPKTIPFDGSTIHVLIDGADIGAVDYNHFRADIQALFPGLNNTNGAVGYRILDTTTLRNGLHTISWSVTDNQGATAVIGSRFFLVWNPVAPM